MAKARSQKEKEVRNFVEKVQHSTVTVFVRYSGISVKQEQELRSELRKAGNSYNAIKKTLLRLSFKDLKLSFDELGDVDGSIAAAFSTNDEVSAPKSLYAFSKKAEGLELIGGIYAGKLISKNEIEMLAQLPSKEELLAKVVFLIGYPIRGLVQVMAGPMRGLVNVLHAMQEKKVN